MPVEIFAERLQDTLNAKLKYPTLQGAANFLGVHVNALTAYLDAVRFPRVETIIEFAAKLDVKVGWLLGENETARPSS